MDLTMLRWIFMNFLLLGLLAPVVFGRAIGHDYSLWSRSSEQPINQTHFPEAYDINTNYYDSSPNTGVVREYHFDIINTTAAPDGIERPVLLVNGQFPGPTIEANWGDTVKVHVTNRMQNNGTGIHFHGVRQFLTNQMDGVPSLTQCPVAPGESYTYVWRATQYGTSWYHSHFALQAWEGVFGAMVIHGPTSAEYDEDLGPLFLSDWSHQTVDEMYQTQLEVFRPAQMQGGLLNGKNVWVENGTTVGERFKTTFAPGKRYLIRLINAAVHTHFRFAIDQHNVTVIASDFVPIIPFETNTVPIDTGQRYDIIVTADQLADNYWMRAVPQSTCSNNTAGDNIRGILHYEGAKNDTDPTSIQLDNLDTKCEDFPASQLVPWVGLNAHISSTAKTVHSEVSFETVGDVPLYLWTLGGDYFNNSWSSPTLQQLQRGKDKTDLMTDKTAVQVNTPDQFVILVIQTFFRAPHPIHLHGHDFLILAQGLGTYSPTNVTLNTNNPARRDTATLPSEEGKGGYLVIGFMANNPGVWLLHCHIGFHQSQGFAQQVVERPNEIEQILDRGALDRTCKAWDEYAKVNPFGMQYTGRNGPYESGI